MPRRRHPQSPTPRRVARRGRHAAARLAPAGELDLAATARLDAALRATVRSDAQVELDLRGVDHLDATAAAVVVQAAARAARSGGRLVVTAQSPEVAWYFALTGADRDVEVIACPAGTDHLGQAFCPGAP